jgi:hypothetical protein
MCKAADAKAAPAPDQVSRTGAASRKRWCKTKCHAYRGKPHSSPRESAVFAVPRALRIDRRPACLAVAAGALNSCHVPSPLRRHHHLRHPGRSRSGAEAQTRDPCLGIRREAGRRRRRTGPSPSSRPTTGAEAWIPDTSSFASLGRRSGMTKARRTRRWRGERPPPSAILIVTRRRREPRRRSTMPARVVDGGSPVRPRAATAA